MREGQCVLLTSTSRACICLTDAPGGGVAERGADEDLSPGRDRGGVATRFMRPRGGVDGADADAMGPGLWALGLPPKGIPSFPLEFPSTGPDAPLASVLRGVAKGL